MSRHQPVAETGFLLTRQALDRQGRCELQFWVTTEIGPTLLRVSDHEPLFFGSSRLSGEGGLDFQEKVL